MDEVNITCKYCHSIVGEEYLINQYGDYFCNEDCYENYYNQDIPKVMKLHSGDDHPYIDDYLAIRRQYLEWRLWKEQLEKKNKYVWLEANEMIEDIDQVMEPFMEYFYREGDDGVFAWEIYQYVLKLKKIQNDLLHWHPENRTLYYAFSIEASELREEEIEAKLWECLEKEEDNTLRDLLSENRHPIRTDPNYIFEFEYDRQDALERLENILQENDMEAVLYEAYLCDGECGDYLNRKDDNYWFDGWFACESCADADRYVGTYKPQELQKEIKYYEEHPDDLLKDINGYEYRGRFKAKVRRSCVLCNIELPEWV